MASTQKEKIFQNHLVNEKSPYLLQHADNPVDWYPWGKEAFEKAKREDKPIFLSIGYSTCHWCHVMEHESFENQDIAKKINEYFVPIKVDREERPDIDNIYMSVVTAMTGQGGWPLTVFLTPDQKPFWGGTYFPAYARGGSQGLSDILEAIEKMWETRRQEIFDSSVSLTEVLKQEMTKKQEKGQLTGHILEEAFHQFKSMYDPHFGGFQHAPKFPTSHNLSFLLRYWKRTQDPDSLAMVEVTLQKMAQGGIYDHVGGGFHRYSTDQEWQIPHFEKMLYDQAMIARTCLEVYQVTKKDLYARLAREILDYVLRDMHYPKGGFYSAEDADSLDPDEPKERIKKEGAFYLWRYEEIEKALGDDAVIFNYFSGMKEQGNALHDPQGEFKGKNIIFVAEGLSGTAKNFQKSEEEITKLIRRSLKKLFELRSHRLRPHLDDKILVDWNGLMIGTLSLGARVLNELRYQKAAEESAQFILEHLKTTEGRLLHRYREEEAGILGTLEDYAFFIHGLLDLYETSFEVKYLKEAVGLAEAMLTLFWDQQAGGFFLTGNDSEELIFRPKEIYDGAIPSGNSIAALDLIRLYHFTLDPKWQNYAHELFQAFAVEIKQRPHAYAQFLMAFDFLLGPTQEIVIAGNRDDPRVAVMLGAVSKYFLPREVTILHAPIEKEAKLLVEISPFVQEQIPLQDQATVYVCENHVCELPLHDVQKFEEILKTLR